MLRLRYEKSTMGIGLVWDGILLGLQWGAQVRNIIIFIVLLSSILLSLELLNCVLDVSVPCLRSRVGVISSREGDELRLILG